MKIACLVTGVPRTFDRCAKTLKKYFQYHHVDYYLVFRDENSDKSTKDRLLQIYKPMDIFVTNRSHTAEVEKICTRIPPSVVMMWHECLMGSKIIETKKHDYDCFVRTRFDAFFATQFFRDDVGDVGIIPNHYSWTGLNDMYFAGRWDYFEKYCNTYNLLDDIRFQTPEILVKTSFNKQNIKYREEHIPFSLFRPWFDHLTDDAYEALIHDRTYEILMKYEFYKTNRAQADNLIRELSAYAEKESAFPLGPMKSGAFYGPEHSPADGAVFRFFAGQTYINIPIPANAFEFEFIARHWIRRWPLEKMAISIDGYCIHYNIDNLDNGTARIKGKVPFEVRGKAPWSKFAITYMAFVTPSVETKGSKDDRRLSMAISPIEFLKYPKPCSTASDG